MIDQSGTITTGGTSQELAPARTRRRYFLFENISAEDMWLDFGTAAVADEPSIKVPTGGSFVMESGLVSSKAINVIAATTGSKFVAKEG